MKDNQTIDGEPVAEYQYRYRSIHPLGEWSKWESISEASYTSLVVDLEFGGLQHQVRKLYAEQPAPVAIPKE